jgi:geranylgeranylglyceryl phosphate synthase family protein
MIEAKEYFRKCKHFTQIDPGNLLTKKTLDAVLIGDTDAVIVAGTQGVKETYAVQAINKISNKTDKPIYFAPSHPLQVGKAIASYIDNGQLHGMVVYHPLNSKNSDIVSWPENWRAGLDISDMFILDAVVDVGYIVTNPKSTVGKLVNPDLSSANIAASVKKSSLKEFYLDGSGELVSTKLIAKVKEQIWDRHGFLLVGGGIDTTGKAYSAMNNGANAINVGTVLEKGNLAGYRDTIKAAKKF